VDPPKADDFDSQLMCNHMPMLREFVAQLPEEQQVCHALSITVSCLYNRLVSQNESLLFMLG